jgi:hypothetical protein
MKPSFIMPNHTLRFGVFLWSIIYLRWLTTKTSAFVSVHDTIKMECCLIKKHKEFRKKSHHSQISVAFPHKASFYSHGRLVSCAASAEICMDVNANVCVQRHKLWSGDDAAVCLLYEPTCTCYVQTCQTWSLSSLDILAISNL